MNILLTGASGFLGKILHAALEEKGHKVVGVARTGQELNIDIAKPFQLKTPIPIDVVVHAAGKAHSVPVTDQEKQLFFDTNYDGTKNLCAAIDDLTTKPTAFVFISTVAVYGLDKGENIIEENSLAGVTPYAKSKIMAEEFLQHWAKANNIVLGILRLPLVAGPNPPGNLGTMINGIKKGRYLSIGKANANKSIVWAADIASILDPITKYGGIYNLTDGIHPNFKQLETVISSVLKKKNPLSIPLFTAQILGKVGDLAGNRFPVNTDKLTKITSTLTFNDQKARDILSWNPSPVLDKLTETL